MSEHMEIIVMDKPAYTLEEYRCLRKHNREICRYFPEEYGMGGFTETTTATTVVGVIYQSGTGLS